MRDTLKSIGGMLLGLTTFVAFIIVVSLLFIFGAQIAFTIGPFISLLAGILFALDCLFLLLAVSRKLRPYVGLVLFISSFIFGMSLWIYGLAVTLSLWGVLALIIGLVLGGVGVVPIGMLAAIFHGEWSIFFTLLSALVLTYGTRLVGIALAESGEDVSDERSPEGGIIEVKTADSKPRTWGDLE